MSVVIGRGLVGFLLPPKWIGVIGALVFIGVGAWMLTGLQFSGEDQRQPRAQGCEPDAETEELLSHNNNSSTFFDAISQSSPENTPTITSPHISPLRMSSMVFLGEWGDRSQLALIALSAQENFWGVVVGAVIGHAVCTGIACVSGHLINRYFTLTTGKIHDKLHYYIL